MRNKLPVIGVEWGEWNGDLVNKEIIISAPGELIFNFRAGKGVPESPTSAA